MCDAHKLRKCYCPAAMLWGCSSGRLHAQGTHDPAGAALQYLTWGAPFVLANLWDVTDKDIDKLSMSCMKTVFDSATATTDTAATTVGSGSGVSVAGALKQSRDVCKLQYAVGSAPVMYGLPARTSE